MFKKIDHLNLINTYSVSNVGDAAIYATLIQMSQEQGISCVSAPFLLESVAQLKSQLGQGFKQSNNLESVHVAVGGDIFNNYRPHLITKQFIKNLSQLSKKPKNTILFGQSIPRSCRGVSFSLLCCQLKKLSSVIVRDQESFNRLQQAGVNAKLSYDSVFAATTHENHSELIKDYYQQTFDNLALLSLRSFDHLYPHDNQRFLYQLSLLIDRLKIEGFRVGVILQSNVNSNDSDIAMINALQKRTSVEVIDPFAIQSQLPSLLPWQITQAFVANAKLVFGVRYHTVIFRLLAGKMPFNLFYSNKGEDLSNRIGVPGCSVNDFSVEQDFQRILDTQTQNFNVQVIADQVKDDFSRALHRIQPNESMYGRKVAC